MNRVITLSLLGSLSLVACTANAAITSTAGSVFWHTSQPTSALPGALTMPVAHVWDEQQNVSVSGQAVNIASSFGSYTGSTPNFATVSGTFDSHFIHFDLASGVGVTGGFISFSSNIAAVIYQDTLLDLSDPTFGWGGTTYATFFPFRSHGSALNGSNLSLLGNSMQFNLVADTTTRMIEVRVLTYSVPAPGSLALVGLGGLVAARRRRG